MESCLCHSCCKRGSLINPFQPIVVRGFSKYTRITISRLSSSDLVLQDVVIAIAVERIELLIFGSEQGG
ncbi:MAG TPA: hypothetical protein V6C65_11015 [Allocoleopsis sp.]